MSEIYVLIKETAEPPSPLLPGEDAAGGCLSANREGNNHAGTLTLDFQPLDCEQIYVCC